MTWAAVSTACSGEAVAKEAAAGGFETEGAGADVTAAEASQPEGGEPSSDEQVRTILTGTAISGVAYGAVRALCSTARAEDLVDMLHSLGTSSFALYGVAQMESHPLLLRVLPAHLASGSGPVVRMFSYSLGYFVADAVKIFVDIVIRRKFPHLWAGRLAHHVVQLGANYPAIFGRGRDAQRNLAWRSVLCRAYIAELSSVFLRLSNLVRHRADLPWARVVVNWSLMISFFGSRIVNFAIAIFMLIRARPVLPSHINRLGTFVTAGGYTLSAVWFVKIVRIALSTKLTVPSIEC